MATTMYPPQNNSPHTTLAANINAVATSITVDDGSILPAAPNALTIGLGEDAELVLMTAKTGDILTVERGYNDTTAKDWMAGDWMYRAITAQDIKAMQDNIAAAGDVFSRNGDVAVPSGYKGIDVRPFSTGVSIGIGKTAPETVNGVDVAASIADPMRNAICGFPNYEYSNRDLSQIYTAAELHAKVEAGDFSGVRIGDYWPITLTGTYYDYAESANKTLSAAVVNLEVAGIDTYLQYSDTAVPHHLVMISRDCLPDFMKMRSAAATWYDTTVTNPWLGSAAYKTLNDPTNGILPIVAATDIGAYIYAGANDKGMRFIGEIKAAAATAATNYGWVDRGKLWLPTEREVWGQDVWSEHTWGGGVLIQLPIFAGSTRHIIKGLGNGGSRCRWWCSSSMSGSADNFCGVAHYGYASNYAANYSPGAPLCFLLS